MPGLTAATRSPRITRLIAGLAILVLLGLLVVRAQAPARVEVQRMTILTADGVELDAARYGLAEAAGSQPALLLAHGFGDDRTGLHGAAQVWARTGRVVMTWSARGFGASGGEIGLADPAREIADVSLLIDRLALDDGVIQDGDGDPRVAIAGGSYGGGTALLAAAADPRIDVVAAVAAWNDLGRALAPGGIDGPGVWKDQWASLLFTTGSLSSRDPGAALDALGVQLPGRDIGVAAADRALCGRFAAEVCAAYADSAERGGLTPAAEALASRASPHGRVDSVTTPTLLVHASGDDLFGLEESLHNAEELAAAGAPVAVRWIDGPHGGLGGPNSAAGRHVDQWLDQWLLTDDAPRNLVPFTWRDSVSGRDIAADVVPAADGRGEQTGGGGITTFQLTTEGLLLHREGDPAASGGRDATVAMIRPAGALPASLSTLPGLGSLAGFGRLLPPVDIPGQALAFTTRPLDEDMVLIGRPRLSVELSAESPDGTPMPATVHVKLIDVAAGGQAQLIGATSSPVRVQEAGPVDVALGAVAHRIVAGNRLRLVVATTDQAYADDPAPSVVTLGLGRGAALRVPVGDADQAAGEATAFGLLAPVMLLVLLGLTGLLLVRRDERLMGAQIGDPPHTGREDDIAVRASGLVKVYADGKVAVDGLDLEVRRGQVFGLLGPNGSGKTTTMRMLLGLIIPTSGTVHLLGTEIRPGHPILSRVGVVVEGPGFAPHLTGRQNLVSSWRAGRRPLDEAAIDRAIDVADLGPAIDQGVRTYSHGMKQRLAIAQALLGQPDLLILDEPTDGLDPEQIRGIRELLARLGDEGLTILVSSHLLSEVEQMCTHAAVLQQGRVVAAGAVADLVGSTRSIVVRTDDRDRARAVLATALGPDALADEADGLAVDLALAVAATPTGTTDPVPPLEPADIVDLLVGAGLRVNAVTPRGRLEDAFLALTGQGATRRAEEARDASRRGGPA